MFERIHKIFNHLTCEFNMIGADYVRVFTANLVTLRSAITFFNRKQPSLQAQAKELA